jgi:hypothetical protein
MEQTTTILINKRMYVINFASYSSQFYHYLPIVDKIINSFGPYVNQNNNHNVNTSVYNNGNESSHNSIQNGHTLKTNNNTNSKVKEESNVAQNITDNNVIFLTYVDPIYRYKIRYPSYPGIGGPISLKDANPNLRGEVFTLNANVVKSTDVSNSVNLIITSIQKNETHQMANAPIILGSSRLGTFDISGIISNVNRRLSLLKSFFINFAVLNKGEILFKNRPAYSVEYSLFNPIYKSPMWEKVIFTIIDDQLFVFEYTAKPSNYYTYMPTFQKVINSFEFELNTPISKR